MKKKFDKTAKPSAVDQVMAILLKGQDDDVADALVSQAIKEGLAGRFSFCVCPASEDPDRSPYVATIYPTELDATFKSPYNCIRPLVPGAEPVDGCVETEWHFPAGVGTPAQIAKFLVNHGFVWDKKSQKYYDAALFQEVQSALEGSVSGKIQKKQKP